MVKICENCGGVIRGAGRKYCRSCAGSNEVRGSGTTAEIQAIQNEEFLKKRFIEEKIKQLLKIAEKDIEKKPVLLRPFARMQARKEIEKKVNRIVEEKQEEWLFWIKEGMEMIRGWNKEDKDYNDQFKG